jgi:hypothetical protein
MIGAYIMICVNMTINIDMITKAQGFQEQHNINMITKAQGFQGQHNICIMADLIKRFDMR